MTKTVTEANLQLHYQTNRIEDTLICILEVWSVVTARKNR